MYTYKTTPVVVTPHGCPKCGATGWLQWDPSYGPYATAGSGVGPWRCDACCGTGVLWSHVVEERPTSDATGEAR